MSVPCTGREEGTVIWHVGTFIYQDRLLCNGIWGRGWWLWHRRWLTPELGTTCEASQCPISLRPGSQTLWYLKSCFLLHSSHQEHRFSITRWAWCLWQFCRARVIKKDTSHKNAVVLSFFEDDGSLHWAPADDVRKWLAYHGEGKCTGNGKALISRPGSIGYSLTAVGNPCLTAELTCFWVTRIDVLPHVLLVLSIISVRHTYE